MRVVGAVVWVSLKSPFNHQSSTTLVLHSRASYLHVGHMANVYVPDSLLVQNRPKMNKTKGKPPSAHVGAFLLSAGHNCLDVDGASSFSDPSPDQVKEGSLVPQSDLLVVSWL